jgi:hypothetical protein
MTLEQILATLAVVVPLLLAMFGLHAQNLVRGERIFQGLRILKKQMKMHDKRVRQIEARLAIERQHPHTASVALTKDRP